MCVPCLSKHAYPKEIEFVSDLPKTSSGKIQRNLLKKQQEIAKIQGIKQVKLIYSFKYIEKVAIAAFLYD